MEAAIETGVHTKLSTYQRLLAAVQPEVFHDLSAAPDFTDEIRWVRAQIAALSGTGLEAKDVASLVNALTTLAQKQADLNPAGDSTGELVLTVNVIDGRKTEPPKPEGA